jgi:hypothetical protein
VRERPEQHRSMTQERARVTFVGEILVDGHASIMDPAAAPWKRAWIGCSRSGILPAPCRAGAAPGADTYLATMSERAPATLRT